MNTIDDYIRVGTVYYKLIRVSEDGNERTVMKPWKLQILVMDFSKDEVRRIPQFDDFVIEPAHIGYRRECGNFYNQYEPISHVPTPGDWSTIQHLLSHIFEEQYELGLDYMQLLYLQPKQVLPILLLVSTDRGTGKTTFLNFLKAIFQENATFNTNENFSSRFNADWMAKLLILIDETSLNRREDSERLKNLSTALSFKSESKGKDRVEVGFYGKFVLCSNNEYRPLIIDRQEIRYWVRRVKPLDSDDTNALEKIKSEIPAFLHFLLHRQMSTVKESRMWFAPDKIHTPALDKIMRACRNPAEADMIELFDDIMTELGIDSIGVVPKDVVNLLNAEGERVDKTTVKRILHEFWGLENAPTPSPTTRSSGSTLPSGPSTPA
ncbi:MAG: DUF5906 domain-containing protein [Bacteroidales bacterium]|nr:DUF5906 domain-containing protein [Bacteroidales bacterium]